MPDSKIEFDEATHVYRVGGVRYPSVTTVLSDMGMVDAEWFTEESRIRGTYVHKIVEWDEAGTLDEESIDPALTGYAAAWRKFKDDTGYQTLATEKMLADHTYRFAGRLDNEGILYGKEIVLDIKSGAAGPATALQLAAYEILIGAPRKRYALQLKPSGKYNLIHHSDRNDCHVFLAALACWWWQSNHNLKGNRK